MKFNNLKSIIFVLIMLYNQSSFSRIQYASQRGIISCTTCHYSSSGGGVKNSFGKSVALHGKKSNFMSKQDLISTNLIVMSNASAKSKKMLKVLKDNTSFMTGQLSLALPLYSTKKNANFHFLSSYDFYSYKIGFNKFPIGVRETFFRYQHDTLNNYFPNYIQLGVFHVPFGIVTDEHRSFSKMQTNTTVKSFDAGIMFSDDLLYNLHYDLALVRGYQVFSTNLDWNNASFGTVFNLKWIPTRSNLLVGSSLLWYSKRKDDLVSPSALAIYGSYSFSPALSVVGELVFANNFNGSSKVSDYNKSFINYLVDSNLDNYFDNLKSKSSIGGIVRIDYRLNNKITLSSKTDFVAPDKQYLKDYYLLQGFLFKYQLTSFIDFEGRYEKAIVGRDGVKEAGSIASIDRLIFISHLWF